MSCMLLLRANAPRAVACRDGIQCVCLGLAPQPTASLNVAAPLKGLKLVIAAGRHLGAVAQVQAAAGTNEPACLMAAAYTPRYI